LRVANSPDPVKAGKVRARSVALIPPGDPAQIMHFTRQLVADDGCHFARQQFRGSVSTGAEAFKPAVNPVRQIQDEQAGVDLDLDGALAELPVIVRLCVVLSYHDGMSHTEIATLTKMPLGTVKSHIRRGAQKLQQLLSDYSEQAVVEES
jgi:hypothetical protein